MTYQTKLDTGLSVTTTGVAGVALVAGALVFSDANEAVIMAFASGRWTYTTKTT